MISYRPFIIFFLWHKENIILSQILFEYVYKAYNMPTLVTLHIPQGTLII